MKAISLIAAAIVLFALAVVFFSPKTNDLVVLNVPATLTPTPTPTGAPTATPTPTPAAWSPTSETGLILWLDASDAGTITLNTTPDPDTVSQWDDKSGNAHHMAQATEADQPDFLPTGLNSMETVEFDGVSHEMTTADHADFSFNGELTLGIVVQVPEITTSGAILSNRGSGGLGGATGWVTIEYGASADDYINVIIESGASDYRYLDAATNSFPDNDTALNITSVLNNSTPAIYHDNVSQSFSWTTSMGTVGVIDSSNSVVLGNRPGISRFFTGKISEVILYDNAFSTAQVEDMYDYLAAKWGL